MSIRAGCILQAYHKYDELPWPDKPWDMPEAIEKFKESIKLRDEAHIVTFIISETQARKIVNRLWPNEEFLGATGGQGFFIKTADQVSAVNEVLTSDIQISVSDKHTWMLQTWPVLVDSDWDFVLPASLHSAAGEALRIRSSTRELARECLSTLTFSLNDP